MFGFGIYGFGSRALGLGFRLVGLGFGFRVYSFRLKLGAVLKLPLLVSSAKMTYSFL